MLTHVIADLLITSLVWASCWAHNSSGSQCCFLASWDASQVSEKTQTKPDLTGWHNELNLIRFDVKICSKVLKTIYMYTGEIHCLIWFNVGTTRAAAGPRVGASFWLCLWEVQGVPKSRVSNNFISCTAILVEHAFCV